MLYSKKSAPIFASLTRPILLLGGERENIILLTCLVLSLCTIGRDLWSLGLALCLWTAGLLLSKHYAKIDPWATKIFLRALRYRDFYPAREKINTPRSIPKRHRKI